MQIAPGEPVPPGFENEVKLIATLQSTIDRYKGPPLIGLEYIVELTFTDSGSPNYICILCDKRSDFNNIMTHLISYDHRIKYLVSIIISQKSLILFNKMVTIVF